MNIPRKPFKFIGELTGYQKGYPSLCLRRPARAPLPSCWLRSFAVESGLGSGAGVAYIAVFHRLSSILTVRPRVSDPSSGSNNTGNLDDREFSQRG